MIFAFSVSSVRSLVVLAGLFASFGAFAWGADAHRLVGELAQTQLNVPARSEVNRLLDLEPGSTLASISTWADETRTQANGPWHYVNLPRDSGCRYDGERDCPDGQCVVAAIERQRRVLASNAADPERLRALKFLVHFVGDIHQPLHAGHADDRGGNTYQLQAFGRGTNLHALWDSALVVNHPGGLHALAAELIGPRAQAGAIDKAGGANHNAAAPAQWAEESCRIVSLDWFYPARRSLDADYAQRAQAVIQQRIRLAGQRLAEILNQSLGQGPQRP